MQTHSHESTHYEEAREAMSDKSRDRRQESGFALILAILSLMLLTFLGLTLATTTSTELRIATNYRWNMQALYNAEAGIEVGKRVLQTLNWDQALPGARGPWAVPTSQAATSPPRPGNPTGGLSASARNWEMWDCDRQGNSVGYGVVLFDGTNSFDNVTTVPSFAGAPALNGAFTLWIRRPVQAGASGFYQDDPTNPATNMILTAEGVAPFVGGLNTTLARNNQARRIIEVTLLRQQQPTPCDVRGGQIGGGPEGNNVFGGPCTGLDVTNALSNVTFAPGAKTRITP